MARREEIRCTVLSVTTGKVKVVVQGTKSTRLSIPCENALAYEKGQSVMVKVERNGRRIKPICIVS